MSEELQAEILKALKALREGAPEAFAELSQQVSDRAVVQMMVGVPLVVLVYAVAIVGVALVTRSFDEVNRDPARATAALLLALPMIGFVVWVVSTTGEIYAPALTLIGK